MSKDRTLGIIALIMAATIAMLTMFTVDPTIRMEGDPGSRIFPYGISILFAMAGLRLIMRKDAGENKVFLSKTQWIRLFSLFAILGVYVFLIWIFGFNIATVFLLFTVSTMFAKGQVVPLWQRMAYSIIMAFLIYLIFRHGLKVYLPTGMLNIF